MLAKLAESGLKDQMDFSGLEFVLVMSVESCIREEKMAYNVWCRRILSGVPV